LVAMVDVPLGCCFVVGSRIFFSTVTVVESVSGKKDEDTREEESDE
jgi:hypothetical protein